MLVFPTLFFPNSDPTTALLASFATFSIAFFARPLGAVVFGHFGDRIGRKTTLVAALLTMGISTVVIGLLPSYGSIGVVAPLLLALCRFGQGFGLGGRMGRRGAARDRERARGQAQLVRHVPAAWRPGRPVPVARHLLAASAGHVSGCLAEPGAGACRSSPRILLIVIGLWVRLSITETPAFQKAIDKHERVAVPVAELFRKHKRSLFLGTFVALATFVLFYIGSAYLLSYNVKVLKIPFLDALEIQIVGSVAFGIFIPIVGKLAERFGRREMLILTTVLIGIFSFFLPGLMTGGEGSIVVFAIVAMALMGMTYGLIGTALAAPSQRPCATPARRSPSTLLASSALRWRPISPPGCRQTMACVCRLLSRSVCRDHADLHPGLGPRRSLIPEIVQFRRAATGNCRGLFVAVC